jgi:TatD DNase family protein
MFFDTHTHVNFSGFKDDADEVIRRALDGGVWLNNVGTQLDTSRSAVEFAGKYGKGVFASIGLHPIHTYQQMVDEEESRFKTREEEFDPAEYGKLINEKVVAVGECGLDYYRLPEDNKDDAIRKQKESFVKQLKFAAERKLPVIIHCRDLPARASQWQAGAYEDVIEILKAEYAGLPGVIHSFTDTWDTAKKFLDLGFYVALNGILTFDKTGKLAEVVKNTPSDRILSETDAPYLTPPPYRGKRNEPAYVKYVVEKMAQIKNASPEEFGELTFRNACSLFKIAT